jgi:hypothetical protein
MNFDLVFPPNTVRPPTITISTVDGTQGASASERYVTTQVITIRVTFSESIRLDTGYTSKMADGQTGTGAESANFLAVSGLNLAPLDRTAYPPLQSRQLTTILVPARSFELKVKL